MESTNLINNSVYDSYAKQLLSDLFLNGRFGLIGDKHNLIVPLIFDTNSQTLKLSQIPLNIRPFCAVLTAKGLYLGQRISHLVSRLFSYLLNELFSQTSAGLNKYALSEMNICMSSNTIPSLIEIEKLQTSIFCSIWIFKFS